MKILFICIGNTCRSPMAEAVMKFLIAKKNLEWEVDSAGLREWNVGKPPQDRCLRVLKENNLKTKHIGRMLQNSDFEEYDYILGMDESNIEELKELYIKAQPLATDVKIELLGSYIGREEDKIIQDPYFSSGYASFRCCYAQIHESCIKFINAHLSV